MSKSRPIQWTITVAAASVVAAFGFTLNRTVASAASATGALTPETFEAVKTRVLPSASDLAWQQVDWRDGYFEGVLEAQRQDKPIFYWLYEGDPRGGC